MFIVEWGTWRCAMLSEHLNSLTPKFHSLLKELLESGREYPWDLEHLYKSAENTWKAAVSLPADLQIQSRVQSGLRKWSSSTHSFFCKQIVPANQKVGTEPVRKQRSYLLLAAQEHCPVCPQTSPVPSLWREKAQSWMKEVRGPGYCSTQQMATPPELSSSSHIAFTISKIFRLHMVWCVRAQGCWQGGWINSRWCTLHTIYTGGGWFPCTARLWRTLPATSWGCPTSITTDAALAGSMQVAEAELRLAIQQIPCSPVLLFGVLGRTGYGSHTLTNGFFFFMCWIGAGCGRGISFRRLPRCVAMGTDAEAKYRLSHRLIFYSSNCWVLKEWPSASVCNRRSVYTDIQQIGIICIRSVLYEVLLHFWNMKIDWNHD